MLNWKTLGIGIGFLFSTLYFITFVEQGEFMHIMISVGLFSVLSTGTFLYAKTSKNEWLRPIILLGIGLRILVGLSHSPALSDDYYRYHWDGMVMLEGINPYQYTPDEYMEKFPLLPEFMTSLAGKINSPSYHSVYPVGSQLLFYSASYLAGNNTDNFSRILRLFFFLAEILLAFMLWRLMQSFGADPKLFIFYILNPFVLFEFIGNLHFDLIFVAFLLSSIFYALKRNIIRTSLLIGLACSIKPQALVFAPFVVLLLGDIKSIIKGGMISLISTGLVYLPIYASGTLPLFAKSLDLYFRNFEFNASLYYLIRWIGFEIKGYNLISIIGPLMSITAFLIILSLWSKETIAIVKDKGINQNHIVFRIFHSLFLPLTALKKLTFIKIPRELNGLGISNKSILSSATFAYISYLLLSTTVHPWYILPVLCLGLILGFRWCIAMSVLFFFSYSFYDSGLSGWSFIISLSAYVLSFGFFLVERKVGYNQHRHTPTS